MKKIRLSLTKLRRRNSNFWFEFREVCSVLLDMALDRLDRKFNRNRPESMFDN